MTKQRLNWRAVKSPARVLFGAALVLSLVGVRHASGAQVQRELEVEDSDRPNPNPALFPKESHPYGASMETWAENFWRWVLSVPAAENPFLSTTSDCSAGQRGPVFFVPPSGVGSKNVTRSCIVEHGKAIGVSESAVLNDFPCPDPTFKPAPGQSLFDFLLAGAVAGNGDIAQIETTLDGEPLSDLLSYHFASHDLFFFKGDLSLQSTVDGCITGGFQPAVVDSYFILFKPLSPGHHVITRRIVTTKGVVSGPNSVNIEVLPEHAH
jgi:hypothetical protein